MDVAPAGPSPAAAVGEAVLTADAVVLEAAVVVAVSATVRHRGCLIIIEN